MGGQAELYLDFLGETVCSPLGLSEVAGERQDMDMEMEDGFMDVVGS